MHAVHAHIIYLIYVYSCAQYYDEKTFTSLCAKLVWSVTTFSTCLNCYLKNQTKNLVMNTADSD